MQQRKLYKIYFFQYVTRQIWLNQKASKTQNTYLKISYSYYNDSKFHHNMYVNIQQINFTDKKPITK